MCCLSPGKVCYITSCNPRLPCANSVPPQARCQQLSSATIPSLTCSTHSLALEQFLKRHQSLQMGWILMLNERFQPHSKAGYSSFPQISQLPLFFFFWETVHAHLQHQKSEFIEESIQIKTVKTTKCLG